MPDTWTTEDAARNFNEVMKAASQDGPQYLTKQDKPVYVLLTALAYEALMQNEINRNKAFVDLLMSIPKGDPIIDEEARAELNLRDVEF